MANITKHDTEKEGEGHHCENSRIDFLIVGYTIGINDLLEDPSNIISAEQRRWLDAMIMNNLELRNLDISVLLLDSFNLSHGGFIVKLGDPAKSDV